MSKPYIIAGESDLRHMGERLRNGHVGAAEALQVAFDLGAFAIGTAQKREGREPRIPMTVIRSADASSGDWMPRTSNENGIVVPVVRFGKVVGPVVMGAFVGDPNTPCERFTRRDELPPTRFMVDPSYVYHKGSVGWSAQEPDGTSTAYHPRAHHDYLAALAQLPDDHIVGEADIVLPPDAAPVWAVPTEPGHFSTPGKVVTLDSWPIRAGDVRALGHIQSFHYQPIIL